MSHLYLGQLSIQQTPVEARSRLWVNNSRGEDRWGPQRHAGTLGDMGGAKDFVGSSHIPKLGAYRRTHAGTSLANANPACAGLLHLIHGGFNVASSFLPRAEQGKGSWKQRMELELRIACPAGRTLLVLRASSPALRLGTTGTTPRAPTPCCPKRLQLPGDALGALSLAIFSCSRLH